MTIMHSDKLREATWRRSRYCRVDTGLAKTNA
jgi:hypothetical protein